jgi:hypothetical protein
MIALKALAQAVEKSVLTGAYDGTGDMMVKNYRDLHAKVVQLLPEDYYVTSVLVLDVPHDAPEKQKAAHVNLAINQLVSYLDNLLRGERNVNFAAEIEDLKELGRDLQQQIVVVTRKALRRALANIDVEVDIKRDPPQPPEPPQPPQPPEPPSPPGSKSTPIYAPIAF